MQLAWSPSGKPLSPSNQRPLKHSLTHIGLCLFSFVKTGRSTVSALRVDHYCVLDPYFPNNWNESRRYVSQSCPAIISNIQKSLCNACVDAEHHRNHSALNLLCAVAGFPLGRWRWGNGFDCKSAEVILQHIHTLLRRHNQVIWRHCDLIILLLANLFWFNTWQKANNFIAIDENLEWIDSAEIKMKSEWPFLKQCPVHKC